MRDFKCDSRSWKDTYEMARKTAKRVISSGYNPDFIVGLTRGGWVPAMEMSDLLGIKDLFGVKVEHWGMTATKDKKARLKLQSKIDLSGRKVLMVDDISDTGESMELAFEYVKGLSPQELKTATLIYREGSRVRPDFYAEKIDEWKWIMFPWNITEDSCNLVRMYLQDLAEKKAVLEDILDGLQKKFGADIEINTLNEALKEAERRGYITRENRYLILKEAVD